MTVSTPNNHRSRPTLEALESRLVLDNSSFVHNVYHDLLNRTPDSAGNATWLAQLNSGISRQNVAIFFWRSVEHRQLEVNDYYQRFLNRAPDAQGNSAVMAMLRNGATELSVQVTFLSSTEFRNNHVDNTIYVDSVFNLILNRDPTDGETAFWVNRLNTTSLQSVASDIINSTESYRLIAISDFQTYLGRGTDNAGRDFWANQLRVNGGSIELVAEAFISSTEYFNLPPK